MKQSDYDYMEGIHRKLLRRICRIWKSKTDPLRKRPISYREVLRITKCETLGTLIRHRRLTFAGHIARMKDGRLPKLLLLSEFAGGKGRRGAKKTWCTCLADDLNTLSVPLTKWISLASNEITWAQVIENGAGPQCISGSKPRTKKHSSEPRRGSYPLDPPCHLS